MPHLKIIDVKNQLDKSVNELNEKLRNIEETLESLKTMKGCSCEGKSEMIASEESDVSDSTIQSLVNSMTILSQRIDALREDTAEHVRVYNNHIVNQHNK
jgi:sugar-specific transcriptional regulator TrmB